MKRLVYCLVITLAAVCMGMNCGRAMAAEPRNQGEASIAPQNQDDKSGQQKPAKKDYRTAKFIVSLTCENCVNKISENIAFEKGVKGLDIKLEEKTVSVIYDATKTDEKTLGEAITKLGFEVEPVAKELPPSPEQK